MEKSQEEKFQSESTESPEKKAEATSPSEKPVSEPQSPIPPVSRTPSSSSSKTIGIILGAVLVIFLLGIIIVGGRQRRQERWKEWQTRRQQPTVSYPSPTPIVAQPTATPIPAQPTSTPTPTTAPSYTYQVTITESQWNEGLKKEVTESQSKTYPLSSLTVSLYEGSGRVNASWKIGASYTAELYVNETKKELSLRNPSFTGAGSLDETYRNQVTDAFQTEITSAIKSNFSTRLDYIELHSDKIVFFYR